MHPAKTFSAKTLYAGIVSGRALAPIFSAIFFLVAGSGAHAANAKNGMAVFQRCAICHTTQKGAGNGMGPNLFGIVGRKAANLPNFSYSAALKNSGIVWTPAKLLAWVQGPAKLVPGTKMVFFGITNSQQAQDLVAYLGTLK